MALANLFGSSKNVLRQRYAGEDTCGCRPCTYPNGVVVLLLSQILLLFGALLATTSMADCQFVTVDNRTTGIDDELADINLIRLSDKPIVPDNNDQKRGLGFFFFEQIDGECSWHYNHTEDTFENYFDLLEGWDQARNSGVTAVALAWIFWIWLLLFTCIAHIKVVRLAYGIVLLILLVVLQAGTFAVLDSDFCTDRDCQIGRSAKLGAVSIVLFAISGILVCFTRNYPGNRNSLHTISPEIEMKNESPNSNNNDLVAPSPKTTDEEEEDEDIEVQQQQQQQALGGGGPVPSSFNDNDGLSTIQEVSVESDMVDISLVDTSPKAQFKAHQMATVYG